MFPYIAQIVLQVLDGVLTYRGIQIYGTMLEGNSMVRSVMEGVGVLFALVLFKAFGIACALFLKKHDKPRIRFGIHFLNLFYLVNAVVWIFIIANAPV